ncbi:fluoride efflux transporter FluC [Dietzia sp. NPDC055343]
MSAAVLVGWAALGGGVGAAARYAVDEWVTARWRRAFPLGIFLVNVTGSLLLGVLVGLTTPSVASAAAPAGWVALVGTGVLGGYTTFSTASLDAVRLALACRGVTALAYAVGTVLATICAALLGLWLGGL